MKIFVQIASYRDPELVKTIKDMLANAKRPKNLVLGIARQFSESDGFDNLDKWRKDKRFKILDIPYTEAQGVCWARNLVQQLYNGEEYTLQIDSHMRFVKDWDDIRQGIRFDFLEDNHYSELKDSELLTQRITLLQQIDPYIGRFFSDEWIKRNLLRMTDDQIAAMDKQIKDSLATNVAFAQNKGDQQSGIYNKVRVDFKATICNYLCH